MDSGGIQPIEVQPIEVQGHWYPGHMAKARRRLLEALPRVDAVLEVADARIPSSSRNPDLLTLAREKARVLLLGRDDLADPGLTRRWVRYLRGQGEVVLAANLREGRWAGRLTRILRQAAGRPRGGLRAVVVGIPNVGKSTAINALARRRGAGTGGVPGITRGPQWLTGHGGLEWLDTPGMLWPRLDDPQVRFALAVTGAIPGHLLDTETVALALIAFLSRRHPGALAARYGAAAGGGPEGTGTAADGLRWLEHIGRARNLLAAGGQVDTGRAAQALLQDFRTGRLGRITLEEPPGEAGEPGGAGPGTAKEARAGG